MHEDWKVLTEQQRERELDLKKKEQELVLQRQELEQERLKIVDEVSLCNTPYIVLLLLAEEVLERVFFRLMETAKRCSKCAQILRPNFRILSNW